MTEHLTDPRRELTQLREAMGALQRDRALLEILSQQEAQCREAAEQLRQAWDKEQADVDRLERVSLSSLLAGLTGRKEEHLAREEAEAVAARLRYQTAQRQLEAALRAREALAQGLSALDLGLDALSVCLDDGLDALYALLGRDPTADLLEEVFSKFCVGK